jgi:hypothetical protein
MTDLLGVLQRQYASELAREVRAASRLNFLDLLNMCGVLEVGNSHVRSSLSEASVADSVQKLKVNGGSIQRVGIWERKPEGKEFVRQANSPGEWKFWANRSRIPAKVGHRRVLLLGESVARGYLYDPHFTPADALQSILDWEMGPGKTEVIDLAKTSLGFELVELAIAAQVLEPDCIVIWAGNNWTPAKCMADNLQCLKNELVAHGAEGVKRLAEDLLSGQAASAVERICSFYEAKGVPIIWVVPEFNLADWRDPLRNAPNLRTLEENCEWIEYQEAASSAREKGLHEEASKYAILMTELDRGLNPAALYILGELSVEDGDRDRARHWLERARDATVWDLSAPLPTPRPYSITQKLLRQLPGAYSNCQVVDLPVLFCEYLSGDLPGKNLFLDYCHLNSEGIRVCMGSVAACLAKVWDGRDVSWRTMMSRSKTPDDKVQAKAYYLAAIHNAHWYQRYETLHYYCARALEFAPEIQMAMRSLIDTQNGSAPLIMSLGAEKLCEGPWSSVGEFLMRHPNKCLDRALVDAMAAALSDRGHNVSERLAHIRGLARSVVGRSVDLLDFYYLSSAGRTQEAFWAFPTPGKSDKRNYYQAYWKESKFLFVGEDKMPVRLVLACRLLTSPEGPALLLVNGVKQCDMVVKRDWQSWKIDVCAEVVIRGINEVVLRWPVPCAQPKVSRGEPFDIPDVYAIFGEVHSFLAEPIARSGVLA